MGEINPTPELLGRGAFWAPQPALVVARFVVRARCALDGVAFKARVRIAYVPSELTLELSAIADYAESWRSESITAEGLAAVILLQLSEAIAPFWTKVVVDHQQVRGVKLRVSLSSGTREARGVLPVGGREDRVAGGVQSRSTDRPDAAIL